MKTRADTLRYGFASFQVERVRPSPNLNSCYQQNPNLHNMAKKQNKKKHVFFLFRFMPVGPFKIHHTSPLKIPLFRLQS